MQVSNKQKEKALLEAALASSSLIGDVVKLAAKIEDKLDFYLAIEFAGPRRLDDFVDLIGSKLTLSTKIEILRKMSFHRQMKSQHDLVDAAERLSRVRNKLAHSWRLDSNEVERIQSDRKLVEFILGYPRTLRTLERKFEYSFSGLWRSWENKFKKRVTSGSVLAQWEKS